MDIIGIGAVSNLITTVIDKIFPDPIAQAKEREDFLLQCQNLDTQLAQGQLAINQAEAANGGLFVAGWRSFIGWTCGVALAYHFIVQPLLVFTLTQMGHKVDLPVFDLSALNTILMGMLGLGTLHTTEKMGDKGHLPWQK
jgi:hypothetical protein